MWKLCGKYSPWHIKLSMAHNLNFINSSIYYKVTFIIYAQCKNIFWNFNLAKYSIIIYDVPYFIRLFIHLPLFTVVKFVTKVTLHVVSCVKHELNSFRLWCITSLYLRFMIMNFKDTFSSAITSKRSWKTGILTWIYSMIAELIFS